MSGKIDISTLTPEYHQALACMFFAMLPKEDKRYKERKACFELFQEKFNKKVTTYNHAKDTYDHYFNTNNRVGWIDRPIESRGPEYREVYDKYKDYNTDDLYTAVQEIIAFYSTPQYHYMALRIKAPDIVHSIFNGTKDISVDRITDLPELIHEGNIVFIAIGGDKGAPGVDWDTGFYAIAHVTSSPYDVGYDVNQRGTKYFKFNAHIDVVLPEPIPRFGFMNYPATYDAPYIGLEIHRDRSQANSALEDDKAVAIIRAVIDKYPDLLSSMTEVFPEDFMARVLGAATVLLPVSVNYGEDAEKEIANIPTEAKENDDSYETITLAPYTADDFTKEVYMERDEYDSISAILLRKKNIILQGAPGVGKTFMAKRLAYAIMGKKDDSRIQSIQFHQSYSYEDFVVGYRPTSNGYQIDYGPFYDFCKIARQRKGPHFFIIDEINRGNVSKIFGELLMLIEDDKRGQALKLLYTKEDFEVPDNVYLIGMMNTADRSLATLDYALRRRFQFVDMKPAFENDHFKQMIDDASSACLGKLVDVVRSLNKAIREDDSLGNGFEIGHSYFCYKQGTLVDNAYVKSIIEYELVPLVREYWFDDPDKANEWASRLRGTIDD